ncbi:MAG: phage baseplate assembly protein V [Myxococcaceae bacterium]
MRDNNPDGEGPRYFGVYPAIVTSLEKDDQKLGRVELKFPFLGDEGKDVRALATMCTPYADDQQGFEMLPAVDSQVVVAFEAGILRRPYIIGACWNGQEKQPNPPKNTNFKKAIVTKAGSRLEFDDTDGAVKVTLKTKSGHTLEMNDTGPTLTLKHSGGPSIQMTSTGITIDAKTTLTIRATTVTVQSPSTKLTGTLLSMAHTATSIISPSYTPGAGNVW